MHEFSFAQSILDTAIDNATNTKQNNAIKILAIRLRIGEYAHISPDSLNFAFSCISQKTIAENARLEFKQVKGSDVIEIESIDVED